MILRFQYKKLFLLDSKGVHVIAVRPIIPVEIQNKRAVLTYEALIDSGADWCAFPYELGEYLGLDVEKGELKRFQGVTGEGVGFRHQIQVSIRSIRLNISCVFSRSLSDGGYGILGQEGFFDHFRVT